LVKVIEEECGNGGVAISTAVCDGLPAHAFALMLDQINDHVILTDEKGVILYVNRAFERITGYSREEAVGNTPRILKSDHHDDAFYRDLWKKLLAGEVYCGEVVNRRKGGELYYDERTITPLVDGHGNTKYYMSVGREISHRNYTDSTTGLSRRSTLNDRLSRALAARTEDSGCAFALINIDLRRFNRINNSFGYTTGDRLLKIIADRLREESRDNQRVTCVAYLGADSYAILIEDLDDPADAISLASLLQLAIAEPVDLADVPIFITASVGIAISNKCHARPEDVLGESEAAVHRAKETDSVVPVLFDTDYSNQVATTLRLESSLRRAIEAGEFVAYYQPIYAIADESLEGFEALARWSTPDGGVVSPDKFIPAAENSGLIVQIGEQIFRQACYQASQWQQRFGANLKVSVNFSAHQFMLDDLVDRIASILKAADLDPGLLKVEITESATVDDPEAVIARMHELKRLGVELLIDDFGTGFSSLSYLTRYPLDTLKIDRMFVMGSESSEQKASVVKAIISLAHGLGMKVIAEGVETDAQLRLLRKLGCEMAQGYLLGRPQDAETVSRMLTEQLVGV